MYDIVLLKTFKHQVNGRSVDSTGVAYAHQERMNRDMDEARYTIAFVCAFHPVATNSLDFYPLVCKEASPTESQKLSIQNL